jgi:hypothetical protein
MKDTRKCYARHCISIALESICTYGVKYENGGENIWRGIFIICTVFFSLIQFQHTESSDLSQFTINSETVDSYSLISEVHIKGTVKASGRHYEKLLFGVPFLCTYGCMYDFSLN